MTRLVEIDPREITVTPVFKIIERELVHKSEKAGHPVMEMLEVVEVRFAGSKNYSPTFPTDAMWKREGNRTITYAERWPEQYRAFKEGNPQEANGTPLEMLRPYGVTPNQLSLCRALKIYSIEALFHLEGPQVKSLGMSGNDLKAAAKAFMADRNKGASAISEVDELRARIAELESRSTVPPADEPTPAEVENAIEKADAEMAALSDDEISDRIEKLVGARPEAGADRAYLESTLRELEAA